MVNHEGGPITIDVPLGGFEAVEGVITGMSNAFRTANGPEVERLGVKQGFSLQQSASEGILNLLAQMNVAGASSLAAELQNNAKTNPYTDMLAVERQAKDSLDRLSLELEEHQRILAETEGDVEEGAQLSFDVEEPQGPETKEQAGDAEEKAQSHDAAVLQLEEQIASQLRYVRLASAVGAAARATVAVLTGNNQEAAQASLARERKIIEAAVEPIQAGGVIRISTSIGSVAEYALISMLTKLENPPLVQLG